MFIILVKLFFLPIKGKSITRNRFEKSHNDTAKSKLCQRIIMVCGGTPNMLAHFKRSHRQTTAEVDGNVEDEPGYMA